MDIAFFMGGLHADNLAPKLRAALEPTYAGITVEVGRVARWDRPAITVRWNGFADLLPEERFQRIIKVLPEELRTEALSGYVWLELAPGETIDAFLKHPRSEDIAGKEQTIHAELTKIGFYGALRAEMAPTPKQTCGGDFSRSIVALRKLKARATQQRDARLLFIRYGAYCDCQVLETVRPQLDQARGR